MWLIWWLINKYSLTTLILHMHGRNIFLHQIDVGFGLGTFFSQWNANSCNVMKKVWNVHSWWSCSPAFCNEKSMLPGSHWFQEDESLLEQIWIQCTVWSQWSVQPRSATPKWSRRMSEKWFLTVECSWDFVVVG